jgi:hypothetical protein
MELSAVQHEAGSSAAPRRNGAFSDSESDDEFPQGDEHGLAAGGLDEDEEEGDEMHTDRLRDEGGEGGGATGSGARNKRNRGPSFAGAAFGLGGSRRRRDESTSDAGSQSQTSSTRRQDLERRVFPVPGLRCVLCSLAHRIAPVEQFIDENATRLETTALFRFAVVVYNDRIKAPLEAEGATVPELTFEAVSNHFRFHCAHPKLQRAEKVKTLTMVREKISERLVRYEEDGTGTGEVDKSSFDLWLKAAAMESRERSLLFPTSGGSGKKTAAAPGQPNVDD